MIAYYVLPRPFRTSFALGRFADGAGSIHQAAERNHYEHYIITIVTIIIISGSCCSSIIDILITGRRATAAEVRPTSETSKQLFLLKICTGYGECRFWTRPRKASPRASCVALAVNSPRGDLNNV